MRGITENKNFEIALSYAKEREYLIFRSSWPVGRRVSMTKGKTLKLGENAIWSDHILGVAKWNDGQVELKPYFKMETENGEVQIGWTPSMEDLFAEDWCYAPVEEIFIDEGKQYTLEGMLADVFDALGVNVTITDDAIIVDLK